MRSNGGVTGDWPFIWHQRAIVTSAWALPFLWRRVRWHGCGGHPHQLGSRQALQLLRNVRKIPGVRCQAEVLVVRVREIVQAKVEGDDVPAMGVWPEPACEGQREGEGQ